MSVESDKARTTMLGECLVIIVLLHMVRTPLCITVGESRANDKPGTGLNRVSQASLALMRVCPSVSPSISRIPYVINDMCAPKARTFWHAGVQDLLHTLVFCSLRLRMLPVIALL